MVNCKNFTFKPEFDLARQWEYLDHKRTVQYTNQNVSPNKSVTGTIVGAGRNTLWLGADFFFTIYKAFEMEMSYDLQWNNLYTNHSFYFGIGGNF